MNVFAKVCLAPALPVAVLVAHIGMRQSPHLNSRNITFFLVMLALGAFIVNGGLSARDVHVLRLYQRAQAT